MKTIDLLNQLNNMSKEMLEKDIKLRAENGEIIHANLKCVLKDKYNVLDHSANNTDYLFMSWE